MTAGQIQDFIVAVGVLLILGAVMVVSKLSSRRLTPEGSRKTIHLVMGCTALAFPYVFTYRQSVVYLGIVAVAALLFMRRNRALRQGIGTALLGVQRKSLGDIYFVVAIVLVFLMHHQPFEYLIAIAVLTFADSIAALIGTSYGRYNMAGHAEEAAKSREGSVMFFIVAFMCALIPLQLMTDIGRPEVLVISFLIGILAAMIEAVTRNGNDNLLLPLFTYSFLRYNIYQPLEQLLVNVGMMLVFLAAIFVVYKMTNLTRLSIAYTLLAAYIILIQGGLAWILPGAVLFLSFGVLPKMTKAEKSMVQTYKAIESNVIVGIICVMAAVFFPAYRQLLYVSFSLSFAMHLAINTYSRLVNFHGKKAGAAAVLGFAKATVFIALPGLIIAQVWWVVAATYLALVAVALAFA
ncbi:MAG: hypothetical protein FWG38_08270, partial [Defluviitaleaceae bacterium]|nr:hypothetical protein [Defluviitaleaceae bacterium]